MTIIYKSKTNIMHELIQKLQNDHGLQPAQSEGILNTVKAFIKEKFPMMAGNIDSLFPTNSTVGSAQDTTLGTTDVGDTGNTQGPTQKGGSFLDKISDFVPGEIGEKTEQFAKDKLGGMFSSDKKNQ